MDFQSGGHLATYLREHPEYFKFLEDGYPDIAQGVRQWYEGPYKNYLLEKIDDPISFFRPNLPQSRLLYSKNREGEMPRLLFLEGANKTGKTTLAVAWQISMAVGFYPWLDMRFYQEWPSKKPYGGLNNFEFSRNWKLYRKFLEYCGFSDYKELSEQFFRIKGNLVKKLRVPNINLAIGETFTESVEKDLVPKYVGGGGVKGLIPDSWLPKTKKNQQGVISKITLGAGPGKGSVFHFRSYKSAADEFEGIDATGSILFNEPPPEDIVKAVLRGAMPTDTRAMFAYTALKQPWIYREYINKASRWLI